MEIETFKEIWNKLDEKLERDIRLKEEIGKISLKQKSTNKINKLLKFEIIEISASLLFLIVLSILTIKYSNDWRFLISGCFFNLIMIINLFYHCTIIAKIDKIDLHAQSALNILKTITKLKRQGKIYYQYGLFIFPILLLSLFPFSLKAIHNINVFNEPVFLLIRLIVGLILGYTAAIFINKFYLSKLIKDLENNIQYLNKFESENNFTSHDNN